MQQDSTKFSAEQEELGDRAWADVLEAVDKTYAELVDYQEQLEARNSELLTLRSFLGSIMTSISDYLIVAGKDGLIVDASVSFCTALGVSVDDLVGRHIGNFFLEADRDLVLSTVSQVASLRQPATIDVELQIESGAEPVEVRIAPRLDRRRRGAGVILTGRPLGELHNAYMSLEQSHEDLKQAQSQLVRNEKLASLGRLLAGVAHELNNPISFVYANTHSLEKYLDRFETYFESVQQGASREELVQLREDLRLDRDLKNLRLAIEGARDGSERVRAIVEDLRRLSAEGSGDMIRLDLVDTTRIAANWIERGSRSSVNFVWEGEDPCWAIGRPGHIQQVMMNLIQNATDAMEHVAEPELKMTFAYEGDLATVTIRDNGPGIPEEMKEAVFDPFFTTKDVGQGTGLGLSISHKIIEEHGGALSLGPDQGVGACFRLTLKKGEAE
ncbi:PAS domain-containing sensor histidine kinase [Shimia aestuarii]|uniref:histidine kinase n=1 Tax=Shimia aestuarii TaxID=254406 RepID=A0A1I4PYY0_9RHOB|nr:ATP-binding protein [Shimia aestuarii]SFM32999.1 PAS domain S-box-containing protein [Shimia aestuarii]